ncbi:MAG: restriction endonuclease subunit S, partial [Sediminibacterium sp.]
MKSNYKRIGDCIRLIDERNIDHNVKLLLGLSISKEYIPSVANIIGTDMENYKIIRKNQFACSTMQVRRDGKMPVALLEKYDEAIISAAYPVFEVADNEIILPEYLMMWFRRMEFDREACFYAIGGVRGSIEWEDFCNMQLPVPSITKQKEIVKEYNVLVDRINLNNQLIQKLEETAQAIYKQWFVDFEFPDENGQPYKSNGGQMVDSERGEIPNGWTVNQWRNICTLEYGKSLKDYRSNIGKIPVYGTNGVVGFTTDPLVQSDGIIIGRKGIYRGVIYSPSPFYVIDTGFFLKPASNIRLKWAFFEILQININGMESGSAIPSTSRDDFYDLKTIVPSVLIQN